MICAGRPSPDHHGVRGMEVLHRGACHKGCWSNFGVPTPFVVVSRTGTHPGLYTGGTTVSTHRTGTRTGLYTGGTTGSSHRTGTRTGLYTGGTTVSGHRTGTRVSQRLIIIHALA